MTIVPTGYQADAPANAFCKAAVAWERLVTVSFVADVPPTPILGASG